MELKELLTHIDHTNLSQTATWGEIKQLCDEGIKYNVASVCIPASYVKQASEYVSGRIPICTVIGFPNGYSTTAVKCFEAIDAISNGAAEIDMVINIGWLKDVKYDEILDEIRAVKGACGNKTLKVIIETHFLTEEEKIIMCKLISQSGADFIKTSTGFVQAGATLEDIKLFRENVSSNVKIKAAGGIRGIADAMEFIAAGTDRIGTSRVINEVISMEKQGV
ncbi:MAG: deoxyribose-phosphate aldolase [Ruminococcaceae bacterium]|nr:deoxyribose-phosphate aldolase [Oscillospiraceae bacterium]